MLPMRAGVEVPVEISGENVERVAGCRISGKLERWARSARKAGVATNVEADAIGVGKLVAEITGEGTIEESIVPSLAIGLEGRTGGRVIEGTKKAAELTASARAGKAAAFGKKIERRDARGSLVSEELNDAGHGIAPVKSAFRAMNDLDLIDIVEGEVGKTDETAGIVYRRAINEDFGVIGVSAVEEESGQAAKWAGASDGDARLCVKKVGERNALALGDLLTCNFIDRRSGAAVFERLSIGRNDDILLDALNFEAKVERPVFGSGQVENGAPGAKGRVLERNAVWAGS